MDITKELSQTYHFFLNSTSTIWTTTYDVLVKKKGIL